MKKLITYIMTALLATIAISFAAPDDKEAIISKEKAAWQAFKDKKADEFKKLLSTDLVSRIRRRNAQSAAGAGWDVKDRNEIVRLERFQRRVSE